MKILTTALIMIKIIIIIIIDLLYTELIPHIYIILMECYEHKVCGSF